MTRSRLLAGVVQVVLGPVPRVAAIGPGLSELFVNGAYSPLSVCAHGIGVVQDTPDRLRNGWLRARHAEASSNLNA
jgi:hypothetical protein